MNFSSSEIRKALPGTNQKLVPFRSNRISDVYEQVKSESEAPLAYAAPPSEQATIGVIDTFRASDSDPLLHGDQVHAVVLNHGFTEKDTARLSSRIDGKTMAALNSLLYADGRENFSERLDAYIELTAGQTLSKTNGILRQLDGQENPRLKTLNQSQGESRLGIYMLLLGAAWNGRKDGRPLITETGKKIAQAVGHQPDSAEFSPWQFHQSLIERVNKIVDESKYIAGLQEDHGNLVDSLGRKGVTVVSSAGNDNDEYLETRDLFGHRIPENFDDDITSVGNKIVVGALDNKGTPDPSDDEIAYFSSRYAAVSVLADGIDVETVAGHRATGSSFAAPQVAAELEKLRRSHPQTPVEQLRIEAASLFRATDGYNIL
jgi:hypothetical protein